MAWRDVHGPLEETLLHLHCSLQSSMMMAVIYSAPTVPAMVAGLAHYHTQP